MHSILSQLKPSGVPYAASQCGIERRINQIVKEKKKSQSQMKQTKKIKGQGEADEKENHFYK